MEKYVHVTIRGLTTVLVGKMADSVGVNQMLVVSAVTDVNLVFITSRRLAVTVCTK